MKRQKLNISLLEDRLLYSGIGVGIVSGIYLGCYFSNKITNYASSRNPEWNSLNNLPIELGASILSAFVLSSSLGYLGRKLGKYLDNRD